MTEPLVRPVRESAQVSGVPRDALYEAIREGRIRVIRRGRRLLVPTAELARFVESEAALEEGGDRVTDSAVQDAGTARGDGQP